MSDMPACDVIIAPGPSRSSNELLAFEALHPCACGERSTEGFRLRSGTRPDGHLWDVHQGACPRCGTQREFHAYEERAEPSTGPIKDHYDLVDFFLANVPEPSQIIGPHEFLDTVHAFNASLEPDALAPVEFRSSLARNGDALDSLTELAKFLPDGVDVIPDDAYRHGGWPESRAAHPDCYTRAWIDEHRHAYFALRERYLANWPRIEALEARGPRPSPPPKTRPFAEAALDAHRVWIEKGGIGLGTRLEVAEHDATGARLDAIRLDGLVADHVTFDRANFSFATLNSCEWTGCSAREAGLGSTRMAGSTLVRCTFDRAHMGLTKLGDSTIINCTFDGAHLDRSTWYRATVRECSFRGARFGNAAFDKAVFTDCDFRDADFSLNTVDLLGTIHDALFERCDLRGTRWARRSLGRARFLDCKFGGASGPPTSVAYLDLVNPDLSPDGTGTPGATRDDLCRLLGMDLAEVAAEDKHIRDYWTQRWIEDGDDPNAPELQALFHHPARRHRMP